jgi:hypothetical protein
MPWSRWRELFLGMGEPMKKIAKTPRGHRQLILNYLISG